jgi:lipopolysaccharide/colanic/teichoic acid biosynthesis glycosyltransferase
MMKRLFDLFFSTVGLLLLFPLFLCVSVLIRLDSRGPVFFRQKRLGRGLYPFSIYKFRTMVEDADLRGPLITMDGNKRVTRVGRMLRKTKIDEIPQLINVFKGEMSLVGPRPEVEKYVLLYKEDYQEILKARPGVTDLASILFRDEETLLLQEDNPEAYYEQILLPQKIKLAKEYLQKSSILYDVGLIFLTFFRIFFKGKTQMKSGCAYNILHLISSGGLFGAERVLIEIAEGMQSDTCRVTVGVIETAQNRHLGIAKEATSLGLKTAFFPCSGKIGVSTIFSISDFIKKNKINLVHSHGYKSNLYALLATRHAIPLVATNHNWLTSTFSLKLYCLLDSFVMRFFDQVIAVSKDVREDMLRAGISEQKISVIDNGLNINRLSKALTANLSIKAQLNIPEKNRVIGAVGGLKIEKGFLYLLKAAKGVTALYKDVSFLFVGNGDLKESLIQQSSALGIAEKVVFAGRREDIPELLSIMDIYALSSIKEGLPMALLEAMAAKKPVIATRVGSVPNVIQDGQNGLLIAKADAMALQTAICRLLENPTEAHRFAQAGYDTVRAFYSSEIMCKKYMDLYQLSFT